MSSTNFCEENPKESFSLLLWNHLLIVKILLKQRFWPWKRWQLPACVLKKLTGSRLGLVNKRGFLLHPMRVGHWRKSSNDRSRYTEIVMWLPENICSKSFQEENRNFKCIFLLSKAGMYREYWFNFKGLQKIFLWWPNSLNIRILFKGREDRRANCQKNSGKKSAGKSIVENKISGLPLFQSVHCTIYSISLYIFCGANFGILLYMFCRLKGKQR